MDIKFRNIEAVLSCEKDITLSFIFGSQKDAGIKALQGKKVSVFKNSDLDVGVLLERNAFNAIEDMFIYYGHLYNIFSSVFSGFSTDLVILNEVSIFIQIEAVKGYKIYQKDRDIFDKYIEWLNKKYNDLNFVRKKYFAEMQEAI